VPSPRSTLTCQVCGYETTGWLGRCPGCGEWNTFTATPARAPGPERVAAADARPLSALEVGPAERVPTGLGELDRVLGGGLVPGSLVLLGGDPGVGKSTLLLQTAARVGRTQAVLYVTGEESIPQLRARAERLGAVGPRVLAAAEWDTGVVQALCDRHRPALVIVDSVQTMRHPDCPLSPGSPVQVREVTGHLLSLAKTRGPAIVLVGHVTKDGLLAGPRLLEHMVDVVLLFEGERFSPFRLLRALKNRFGSTQEVGVFQMAGAGLEEVANPSELLLAERAAGMPGSVVTVALEGSRPLLCEVQALLAPPAFGSPRRTASGVDAARLALLLAVLERRCGLRCGALDAYLKVVGGVRLEEPAADLACALALASAHRDRAVPPDVVVCGEIGLGGEVRGVPRLEERLAEAARLGFRRAVVPAAGRLAASPLEVTRVRTLRDALDAALDR
jgi:DNA repair protein RadA/Sms